MCVSLEELRELSRYEQHAQRQVICRPLRAIDFRTKLQS
jgi:hypothetical protein